MLDYNSVNWSEVCGACFRNPRVPQSEYVVAVSISKMPAAVLLDDVDDRALIAATTPNHPWEIAIIVNPDLGPNEYITHYADGTLDRVSLDQPAKEA